MKETIGGQKPNRNPTGQGRRTSDPEPGKPRHRQARTGGRPGQKLVLHLRVPVLGSAPFARFRGRCPRAVPLNPPPPSPCQATREVWESSAATLHQLWGVNGEIKLQVELQVVPLLPSASPYDLSLPGDSTSTVGAPAR